jgi:hypothetical protein
MNNRLLPPVNKFLQEKRVLIDTIMAQRRIITQIQPSRYRRVVNFLIYLIAGLIASTVIALHLAPSGISNGSYRTSWIGNTFGGGNQWVQNNIHAMYVAADGTVYTISEWDEAGREGGIYKDGNVIGMLDDLHGWGRTGGSAITKNNKYIYVGMTQAPVDGGDYQERDYYPKANIKWYCVRRYDLSGKPAPFARGKGWDQSMVIVSKSAAITGLAASVNELYLSDYAANRVRVYNALTMKELRSWTVARPQQIALDAQGNLWIIQGKDASKAPKILHYSKTGQQLPKQIAGVIDPTAIAVDKQGRLLVTENGPRQQVLIYNVTQAPRQIGTLGTLGGIYSGKKGEIGDLKFYGLSAVGADASGNIYVNSNGFNNSGTDLRKFSPSGVLQWQLLGLEFVDNADVDPARDGVDVYTKQEHFVMDYSKPAGQQWTYKGYTINPFKYPQDPRLHTSPDAPFFRRIQGKPFLFLTNMYEDYLQIYRFNPTTDGEIAIPSGMLVKSKGDAGKTIAGDWLPNQPATGDWIWRERNGNGAFDPGEYDRSQDYPYVGGWWVDSKGDVWKTLRTKDGIGIRHYPLQGLDANDNPIYTYSSMQKQTTPAIFTDLRRIEYIPETDSMYLSGFTVARPAINDDAGVVGSEIARFDNWSKGNRTPRWRIPIAYDNVGNREVSTAAMSVAGDYVFAVTMKTAEVSVYNAATGAYVMKLTPGSEVAKESGWIDIPYGLRVYQRANGAYLVFVEEDWKAKVIMYQLVLPRSPQR